MNTLVGLGAGASFGVSCVAAALPGLGWKTFFEEPAMLLGGCVALPACRPVWHVDGLGLEAEVEGLGS